MPALSTNKYKFNKTVLSDILNKLEVGGICRIFFRHLKCTNEEELKP